MTFSVTYTQKDNTAIDVPHPAPFEIDTWETIISNVQSGNIDDYNVGDTKDVDLGSLGIHKLRIANKSAPEGCYTNGFSGTACGFVLEFVDIITTNRMNPYEWDNASLDGSSVNGTGNKGDWKYCDIRSYINYYVYNALPSVLRNAVLNTTVVSGHGSNDTTNITTTDKIYLLSTHEVWEDADGNTSSGIDYYDTAYNNTRQLDYYRELNVTSSSNCYYAKKQYNNLDTYWWLRTASSYSHTSFLAVRTDGIENNSATSYTHGISPAFRIGY